jgi:tRNA/rRNA methyltransferase
VNKLNPLQSPVNSRLANVRIVLVRTSHPGNIGAAARAMKTMGLARLVLVAPEKFPDPVADARATGALDLLAGASVCENLEQALAGTVHAVALSARRRELSHPVREARAAAAGLIELAGDGEVALVFGAEEAGLSNADAGLCREFVMIPTNPEYSSLNLGSAVQVMAYELRLAALETGMRARVAAENDRDLAQFEDIENLIRHFEETMVATGFLDPQLPKRLMPRLRRLFARTALEKEEVNILRGFLRSVNFPGK